MKFTKKQIKQITENIEAVDYAPVAQGDKKTRQKMCRFLTPIVLALRMVEKFDSTNEMESIVDQACGYGNLLIAAMEAEIVMGADPVLVLMNVYGNEPDPNVLQICKENIRKFGVFHKIPNNIVEWCLNTHYNNCNALDEEADQFDMSEMRKQAKRFGLSFVYNIDQQKIIWWGRV